LGRRGQAQHDPAVRQGQPEGERWHGLGSIGQSARGLNRARRGPGRRVALPEHGSRVGRPAWGAIGSGSEPCPAVAASRVGPRPYCPGFDERSCRRCPVPFVSAWLDLAASST
jgi:hypothetical protein